MDPEKTEKSREYIREEKDNLWVNDLHQDWLLFKVDKNEENLARARFQREQNEKRERLRVGNVVYHKPSKKFYSLMSSSEKLILSKEEEKSKEIEEEKGEETSEKKNENLVMKKDLTELKAVEGLSILTDDMDSKEIRLEDHAGDFELYKMIEAVGITQADDHVVRRIRVKWNTSAWGLVRALRREFSDFVHFSFQLLYEDKEVVLTLKKQEKVDHQGSVNSDRIVLEAEELIYNQKIFVEKNMKKHQTSKKENSENQEEEAIQGSPEFSQENDQNLILPTKFEIFMITPEVDPKAGKEGLSADYTLDSGVPAFCQLFTKIYPFSYFEPERNKPTHAPLNHPKTEFILSPSTSITVVGVAVYGPFPNSIGMQHFDFNMSIEVEGSAQLPVLVGFRSHYKSKGIKKIFFDRWLQVKRGQFLGARLLQNEPNYINRDKLRSQAPQRECIEVSQERLLFREREGDIFALGADRGSFTGIDGVGFKLVSNYRWNMIAGVYYFKDE